MAKYKKDKLYPNLPVWEVFCFYPMNKRRGAGGQNWYALPFEERKKLMAGHARVGRTYHGKILQLITGATGLDDWEWGVTLFAHDTFDIKAIVYEMRFDPVTRALWRIRRILHRRERAAGRTVSPLAALM